MVVVAAEGGPEADHAVHFPLAVSPLAVQWSSGVSLRKARVLLAGTWELGGQGEREGLPTEPHGPHVCGALIPVHCKWPRSLTSPCAHSSAAP